MQLSSETKAASRSGMERKFPDQRGSQSEGGGTELGGDPRMVGKQVPGIEGSKES